MMLLVKLVTKVIQGADQKEKWMDIRMDRWADQMGKWVERRMERWANQKGKWVDNRTDRWANQKGKWVDKMMDRLANQKSKWMNKRTDKLAVQKGKWVDKRMVRWTKKREVILEIQEEEPEKPAFQLFAKRYFVVHGGNLLVANNKNYLRKLLAQKKSNLGEAHDYVQIKEAIDKLTKEENICWRQFGRMDRTLETNYEMLRRGEMGKSQINER